MNLTKYQRINLINQYTILSKLSDDSRDKKYYEYLNEILYSGYVGLYYEMTDNLGDEVPKEIYQETIEILNMFRWISKSIDELNDKEKEIINNLEYNNLKFSGFDANNDTHYNILYTMKTQFGKWEEIDKNFNSHSEINLINYIIQLNRYKKIKKSSEVLSITQLIELNEI